MLPDLLITPEALDHVLSLDMRTYTSRESRVAMRAALSDAAGLCDKMADEMLAQHRKGRRAVSRTVADAAAAFKRCGDEIWRMRERIIPGSR